MKSRTKRILTASGILIALSVAGITWVGFDAILGNAPLFRKSAIETTLLWGRLAPFPASAKELRIHTEGSSFTRAFRVSFIAPAGDIEHWLQESSGIRDAQLTSPSSGVRHFEIKPGEGAGWAEVTVDDNQHHVSVYVYWS